MKPWLIAATLLVASGCGTKVTVANVYCDGTTGHPCNDPKYPVCNVGTKTCVASTMPDMACGLTATCPDMPTVDLFGIDGPTPGDMAGDMNSGPDMVKVADMTFVCHGAGDCVSAATPICGGNGQCRACSGVADDGQCNTHTGGDVCLLGGTNAGQCGQCNMANNTQSINCGSTTPVCSTAGTCRKCQAQSECTSQVCNSDGTCAAVANIIYVKKDSCNSGTANGTIGMPYCEITDAIPHIDGSHTIIRVLGSTAKYQPITISGGTYSIIGPDTGTSATISGTASAPVTITGTSANITLVSLEIVGTVLSVDGVDCGTAGGGVPLVIKNSNIHNNGGVGISSTKCSLTLTNTSVTSNTGGGVSTSGSTVTLTNNNVTSNSGGGLSMTGGTYNVTNNFITGNAGAASAVTFGAGSSGIFWFNTVANNGAAATYGAFNCGAAATIQASILHGNTQVGGSSYNGTCSFDYNVIDDGPTTGTGNINTTPTFATVGPYSYALASGSSAEGLLQAASPGLMTGGNALPATDIAGHPRPRATAPAGYDAGAWQYTP